MCSSDLSQVQFAVFLCKIIPRNESFTEMLQMTHFVAMYRVLAEILLPYLH